MDSGIRRNDVVAEIIKQYKLADHFSFATTNDGFDFHIDNAHEVAKASLHGFYTAIEKVRATVKKGKLYGKDKIKKKVEKIIHQYNATEHITVEVYDDDLRFSINDSNKAAEAALDSVYKELEKVRILINQGKYGGKDNIGIRIGKIINKYKVAKHVILNIRDDGFDFHIDEDKVKNEATLDGIYIIRTSLPKESLSASDTVRSYKNLSQVERALRSIKTIDIKVRPIRHRI